MSYLGLDIGTSGCKAVVFSGEGQILASSSRDYAVFHPRPDWAELDSAEVGDACLDCIRRSTLAAGPDQVQALAISSQGEAFTVLDSSGRIISNAMVSSDSRTTELVQTWPQEFGSQRLYEKTGHTPHPIFTLFKLLWLRRERPGIWKRAHRFLCFEDYLHYRLGINPAIGWSLAGRTMLFNVREHRWDPDILEAAGIRPDQLAFPVASGKIVGVIPDAVADDLGLATGVRVVAGGHDQVSAALGAGALEPGQAVLATGTVECITVAFHDAVFNPVLRDSNLCTYAHAVPGLHATLAYNLTGGNLLRWFREQWSAAENAEASQTGEDVYDLILRGMASEPTQLMVLPYFTTSGTPYFDALTPGAILGLRLGTTRGEVLRALLEGLAFEMRINMLLLETAGIKVHAIRAVGGGARNDAWLQLKADILNRPISLPAVTEAGCLGNALLACVAVTGAQISDIAARWVPIQKTILPDSKHAAYYGQRTVAYGHAYTALRRLSRQF